MIAVLANRLTIFFQAEDGIRDKLVTGVQTCALPIARWARTAREALEGQPPGPTYHGPQGVPVCRCRRIEHRSYAGIARSSSPPLLWAARTRDVESDAWNSRRTVSAR